MIFPREQSESQYMSGYSSRTTVFLAKRASTSDADGPKAFPYQVSASESYWSSQETFPTTFLTLHVLSRRPCTNDPANLPSGPEFWLQFANAIEFDQNYCMDFF